MLSGWLLPRRNGAVASVSNGRGMVDDDAFWSEKHKSCLWPSLLPRGDLDENPASLLAALVQVMADASKASPMPNVGS